MLSVRNVLSASKPIHSCCLPPSSTTNDPSSTSSSSWTLRQLVPVHESLCRSLLLTTTNDGDINDMLSPDILLPDTAAASFHELYHYSWLPESEKILCQDVLQTGSDEEKLLVLQYLLFVTRKRRRRCTNRPPPQQQQKHDPPESYLGQQQQDDDDDDDDDRDRTGLDVDVLQGLGTIIIPFLLYVQNKSNVVSLELLHAVLDAVFFKFPSTRKSKDDDGDDHQRLIEPKPSQLLNNEDDDEKGESQWLKYCLEQCRRVPPPIQSNDDDDHDDGGDNNRSDATTTISASRWTSTCQILLRLYHYYNQYILENANNHDISHCAKITRLSLESVMQVIMDKIIESLDGALVADDTKLSYLLRPVTEHFLPLVLETMTISSSKIHPPYYPVDDIATRSTEQNLIDHVWLKLDEMMGAKGILQHWNSNHLMDVMEKEENEKANHDNDALGNEYKRRVLLVVTTIACSILPLVVHCELPQQQPLATTDVDNNDHGQDMQQRDANHRSLPIYHTNLWRLILTCLLQQRQQQGQRQKRTATNTSRVHVANDTLLRRRGIFLLRVLIEAAMSTDTSKPETCHMADTATPESSLPNTSAAWISTWSKYVACAETLEMESEVHLVDQVWPVVRDLCAQCPKEIPGEQQGLVDHNVPPALCWNWIRVLLSRALQPDDTTPVMRKLCLYRFLTGQAGICMSASKRDNAKGDDSPAPARSQRKNRKGHDPSSHTGGKNAGAPLEMISNDFVFGVVVHSFDILHQSIGTTINIDENGKIQGKNMIPMFESFLQNYLLACSKDPMKLFSFISTLFSDQVVGRLRSKTLVMVYKSIAAAMNHEQNTSIIVPMNNELLQTLVSSFQLQIKDTSVVIKHREELLRAIATVLSKSAVKEGSRIEPKLLLQVLSIFTVTMPPRIVASSDGFLTEPDEPVWSDPTFAGLQKWLHDCQGSTSWQTSVGASCATAFVDGSLLPGGKWNSSAGATKLERQTGMAIALLCTLSSSPDLTASQMLWPAIHKGLQHSATTIVALSQQPHSEADNIGAGRVARALILLECGCQFRLLSGMGNGDLVVDRGTQQMMPPPPSIETILKSAVSFLLFSVKSLLSRDAGQQLVRGGSLSSTEASQVSSTFAIIIQQLQLLHEAYPSSLAVSEAVRQIFEDSLIGFTSDLTNDQDLLRFAALTYALLSCGAGLETKLVSVELCQKILHRRWKNNGNQQGMVSLDEQTARSVFHLSVWGSLSHLLPIALDKLQNEAHIQKSKSFLTELLDIASDSVEATPIDSLVPLFHCVRLAGKIYLSLPYNGEENIYIEYLEKIVGALFKFLDSSAGSRDSMFMLNEICSLLFQRDFLMDEYNRLQRDADSRAPIRDAFRRLMAMAGSHRPHISRTALSWITVAWLGPEDSAKPGLCAVPYRDDILKLTVHKEAIIDDLSANQSFDKTENASNTVMEVPEYTNDLSVARSFILVFLSKLPPSEKLEGAVKQDLLHFLIDELLEMVNITLPKGNMIMKGSFDYILQIRGWQALCVLSRFIDDSVVKSVCEKTFKCISTCLHGQIRYFMENFTIQVARKHPDMVGDKLFERLRRRDLSLQEVSTILIIAGNLVVGRYKSDFMQGLSKEATTEQRFKEVLSCSIPWLSSTQGFSRAIAQLLVYQLIPLVVDFHSKESSEPTDQDAVLRSIYTFLEENSEMSRLRKKQLKFFERYDSDSVCTAEGVLKISVDEGFEADPLHLVEAIKQCLQEIYEQSHSQSTPTWRQVAELLEQSKEEPDSSTTAVSNLINFQRKIIPVDALNLLLEDSRERRVRNSVGRRRQQLIICASLVDKVPNLGGLARTAEIFAADRLVVPDINMTHMDNFKTLCVGADEWIQMEEVREENLLGWLREHRNRGYFVVGLEQTSSSVSLENLSFPDQPTILLLGKEKEGIPVEFLQAVDECVEIPQLGIIRSLNVHVSGAIAIWERTKQLMLKNPQR